MEHIDTISSKLNHLGVSQDLYVSADILCLPENILTEEDSDKLYEPMDQIFLVKRLREESINVFTLYDAGIEISNLERRGDEKWFGKVVINKLALPALIAVLSGITVVHYDRATKHEEPKQKVHMQLIINNRASSNRIDYEGDGETLINILETLNEKPE